MELMRHYRYSNTTFAKALGVSASTIGYIDIYRSYPSMETILKLLDLHPDINANWLITGEGQMIKSDRNVDAEIKDLNRQIRILNENNDWKTKKIEELERKIAERESAIKTLSAQIQKMRPL
jgi:transcriptional regulator with XRE-family HTH domain